MFQENVINFKVALHPSFPDLYSVWRFPEQGFKEGIPLYAVVGNKRIEVL